MTFAEAVTNNSTKETMKIQGTEDDISFPLKPLPNPRLVGGNIVVEVDKEDYQRGIEKLKYSVIGRLSLQRGD